MIGPIPDTRLDPVSRLHVVAAALPQAVVVQRRLRVSFSAVWNVVADLERYAPRFEAGLSAVRIVEREGVRLRLRVTFANGIEEAVEARLWSGWCLMQSSTDVAAFAARPVGDGVLLAHLEHRRQAAARARLPRSLMRSKLKRELDAIERLASGESADPR
jgi:hypothetical protein